jgi:two-component system, sensor histidine kinase
MTARPDTTETRVLVLAPTGRDGPLTEDVLQRAGIACETLPDLDAVCAALEDGAGALLIAEEAIALTHAAALARWLATQPPWSDLPVLLLARQGADSSPIAEAMELLGNVTVLERPLRVAALVSAIRAALRARQRQYQAREHLAARERGERELREADRRKDEFLAILAHELRNPLAPMLNSLHVLRASAEPAQRRHAVAVMDRQLGHLVRLVDDLLDVSRITTGKL